MTIPKSLWILPCLALGCKTTSKTTSVSKVASGGRRLEVKTTTVAKPKKDLFKKLTLPSTKGLGLAAANISSSATPAPAQPSSGAMPPPPSVDNFDTCNVGPGLHVNDRFGSYTPASGAVVKEVPLGAGLSLVYQSSYPFFVGGETPHNVWQLSFDQELKEVDNGFQFYNSELQIISPTAFKTRFLKVDGSHFEDSSYLSGSFSNGNSDGSYLIENRDGSKDQYRSFTTNVTVFGDPSTGPWGAEPCPTTSATPATVCATNQIPRNLYVGTTNSDGSATTVQRNAQGEIQSVTNGAGQIILKIKYKNGLPEVVQRFGEVASGQDLLKLEWEGQGRPLLSKLSFPTEKGLMVETFEYDSTTLLLKSDTVTVGTSGNRVDYGFAGPTTPRLALGALMSVSSGTMKKAYWYYTSPTPPAKKIVKEEIYKTAGGGMDDANWIYIDENCKPYAQTNDRSLTTDYLARNGEDNNFIDGTAHLSGTSRVEHVVVRNTASSDVIHHMNVVGEYTSVNSGPYREDMRYEVDPDTGLVYSASPHGIGYYGTAFGYDSLERFPTTGTRLTDSYTPSQRSWTHQSYDARKRLGGISQNAIPTYQFAYTDYPGVNTAPAKVVSNFLPGGKTSQLEFYDQGEFKQYVDTLNFKQSVTLDPTSRCPASSTGATNSTYSYQNGPAPCVLQAINSTEANVTIDRFGSQSTQITSSLTLPGIPSVSTYTEKPYGSVGKVNADGFTLFQNNGDDAHP